MEGTPGVTARVACPAYGCEAVNGRKRRRYLIHGAGGRVR